MKRPITPSGQQRFVEGALDAIRPGWRERRAKRKSPWNLVGVIVAAAIMGPAGYGLWLCAWRLLELSFGHAAFRTGYRHRAAGVELPPVVDSAGSACNERRGSRR